MIVRVFHRFLGGTANDSEHNNVFYRMKVIEFSDPSLRKQPNSEGKLFQKLMETLFILQQKSRRKREGSDQKSQPNR